MTDTTRDPLWHRAVVAYVDAAARELDLQVGHYGSMTRLAEASGEVRANITNALAGRRMVSLDLVHRWCAACSRQLGDRHLVLVLGADEVEVVVRKDGEVGPIELKDGSVWGPYRGGDR